MSDTETSLEDDLAAALASYKDANSEAAPAEPAEAAPEPATEPQEPETSGRDDKGRFTAKTPPAEPEAAPAPPAEPEEPAAVPDRYALAPNYAKRAVKENWSKLPPEVRQELHEREREVHQQFTRFDEDRTFGKKVREVVGPYEGFIRGLGAEPIAAVDYLIKTDYALRTAAPEQRKALFLKAAKDYGITFDGAEDAIQTPPSDPRLETLQQRLERLETERANSVRESQLAEQRSIEQQISDFASKPEHVHFDRVSQTMASFLSSGQATDLEQAYDMAVFANPETRALQLDALHRAEQSRRITETKAQADKAKRASVSVTGAPGLAVPASRTNNAGSLEDDIAAAIRAADVRF